MVNPSDIISVRGKIHYTDELVTKLFETYLGNNGVDPIGKIIWTDEEVLKQSQVSNQRQEVFYTDGEVLRQTQANPLNQTVTYTDEFVDRTAQVPNLQQTVTWTDTEVLKDTQVVPLQQEVTYTDEFVDRTAQVPNLHQEIVYTDDRVRSSTQVTLLQQQVFYTDEEVDRLTKATTLDQQVTYTDERTQQLYQGKEYQNSPSGKITDDVVKKRFEESGVLKNNFNYNHPKGTSLIERTVEYTNLLERNLQRDGGSKLMRFLGMYELLLMLNPRFNYIVNPAVVPGWVPGEGIIPVTLDAIIFDYERVVKANDVPGISSSTDSGVKDAADAGLNLGQIMGSDFKRATSPVNRILNIIPNILSGALGDGRSNDPNVASLEKRLGLNRLKGNEITPTSIADAISYNDRYKKFNALVYSPNGGVDTAPNMPIDEFKTLNNNQANQQIQDTYKLYADWTNYASQGADKSWLVFNIKPNSDSKNFSVTEEARNSQFTNLNDPNYNFDNLVIRELREFGTELPNNINIYKDVISLRDVKGDMQFPFFFEEVSDKNPTWCGFPATVKLQSDTFSPSFSDTPNFIGRPEQAVIYSGTKRNIQIEFMLYVEHPKYLQAYKKRINWLVQRCYPKFFDQTVAPRLTIYQQPPLIRMTIGDIYYRLGGYVSGLTLNWSSASDIWEKHLEGNRIPLTCNINLVFNVLHDFVPDSSSEFFDWDLNDYKVTTEPSGKTKTVTQQQQDVIDAMNTYTMPTGETTTQSTQFTGDIGQELGGN